MDSPAEAHEGRSKVTLEGTYSPADFFEEMVSIEGSGYTATMNDGRVEVALPEPEPLPDTERQAAIRRELERVFQSFMILTGRPWRMTGFSLNCHYPDGRKEVSVFATANIRLASLTARGDTISTDSGGNVIRDSRAERLVDQRRFREQYSRHAENPLLQRLIASFGQAVTDPADQMTHLYEIRDALNHDLGGDKEAKKTLRLTNAEWSDFGRITNIEPIKESRHRGNHPALRPATEEERTRVINIARRMIRAYIEHLDHPPTP